MKKLSLLVCVLILTACQPKSEIDKCVEAKVIADCARGGSNDAKCIKELTALLSGIYREQCLRAQAGKE
jgi:hypothetical protein